MAGRFHKAAQDGLLEILKETTKKDTNSKDEDGMTPTLWAAQSGNLEALRLLVGRGGDVEKANYHFGQTALHLAAARGHLNCVTFLVGFEANLFALDHNFHTPLQVATHPDVIEFLDKAATSQLLANKKEVKTKKEKALKSAERRRRKYEERMKKEKEKEGRIIRKAEKEIDSKTETTKISSVEKVVSEEKGPSFTEIIGGTMTKKPTSGVKKILEKKFKLLEDKTEAITKSPDSGGRRDRSQIIYLSSNNSGKRGKIADVFTNPIQLQSSIFDRPGFGSVAFRQSTNLAGTLSGVPDGIAEKDGEEEVCSETSIGSAGSLATRHQLGWLDDATTSDEENLGSNEQWTPLERFLVSAGVQEYTHKFLAQKIDLEAVLMLNDLDLMQLGIPMGPRRKLLHAVGQRKNALEFPGQLQDSKL